MIASTYKRFLANRSSFAVTHKGGRGKGKGKIKSRWLPQEAPRAIEEVEFDLLMLPHPRTTVNKDDETYVLLGHANLQVRVTKENWDTLKFNTKTLNPEYFPSSYLRPVLREFECTQ
jgi:hypothetical protein